MSQSREQLRAIFDEAALLYDEARPHYPEAYTCAPINQALICTTCIVVRF